MKTKIMAGLLGAASVLLVGQQPDIWAIISKPAVPALAVIDFRGSGDAQRYMGAFNQTLASELAGSSLFHMLPKSFFPLRIPQQPADFRLGGAQLSDWSGAPANADYLAYGYSYVQDGGLVLRGWLYSVKQPDISSAQLFGKIYNGSVDDAGAKKVAGEFAADILKQFGGVSLVGSKIYFVSDRTGSKEIWSMDHDGSNQRQLTNQHFISIEPAVSPDGTKLAYATYSKDRLMIQVQSLETGRRLPFYNPAGTQSHTPSFTPDGAHLIFATNTATPGADQIFMADVNGANIRRLSYANGIVEVEPKLNPANPGEMVFTSGRSGPPQIYRMTIDGADAVRLTDGTGDAVNPSWNPNGKAIAFAWTKGYEPGKFNLFVMNVATGKYAQLTQGGGKYEHPSWAADGLHLVCDFDSGHNAQIYTMLADGTQRKQLTTQGHNDRPVWGK